MRSLWLSSAAPYEGTIEENVGTIYRWVGLPAADDDVASPHVLLITACRSRREESTAASWAMRVTPVHAPRILRTIGSQLRERRSAERNTRGICTKLYRKYHRRHNVKEKLFLCRLLRRSRFQRSRKVPRKYQKCKTRKKFHLSWKSSYPRLLA